ncbi:hypothetical protein NEOLEDRAFT_1183852 [Neolentinus lepideus HHB14362 ss-1]|uniref:Uncharacterized protein n=1 Tax=Neolentinus lepideus HHB14362 ss-1 TaxID=1314782 RepID=A0A165MYQ8_9AGAM|nr:hypothetical protein NEOLEDRAFT_1183852 [Neolentinus lepideus HHB14362 ss-1]
MPVCNGLTDVGQPCPCQRFVLRKPKKRSNGKTSTKKRCECHHKESLHALEASGMAASTPAPGNDLISGIVSKYSSDLGRLLLPEKASEDEARREANAGFRRVPEAGGRLGGKGKGRAGGRGNTRIKATKASKVASRPVTIGRVVLMPYGVKSNGKIRTHRAPEKSDLEATLQRAGLTIDRDGNSVLSFAKEWSSETIDGWLRRLLPKPFMYLDARHGKIAVVERSGEYIGHDLFKVRGGPGKNTDDYVVHFVSAHRIPKSAFKNWESAITLAEEGLPEVIGVGEDPGDPTTDEEEASDPGSDNEGLSGLPSSRPKPRPAYKGAAPASGAIRHKGKLYVHNPDASEASESSSSSEDESDAVREGNSEDVSDWEELGGGLQNEGVRKSLRLHGKKKRSYAEESEVEFVEGSSTKKMKVNGDGHGSEANPFNVDGADPWDVEGLNDILFFPSEGSGDAGEPVASGSGSMSISGGAAYADGVLFWQAKPKLPSPGKPRTSPWPSL